MIRNFTKDYLEDGEKYRMIVKAEFYSVVSNQAPHFALTADYGRIGTNKNNWSGGCCHEEIVKHFPELEKYVKWHLFDYRGPMHYVANSMYHASNKDCWGKVKGEPYRYLTYLIFNNVPIPYKIDQKFLAWIKDQSPNSLQVVAVPHINSERETYKFSDKATFLGYGCEWYQCPFDSVQEATNFLVAFTTCIVKYISEPTAWGEGKEPDLKAARSCAIWPDATLEDFTKEKLEARLPGMLKEFNKDMRELFGAEWKNV